MADRRASDLARRLESLALAAKRMSSSRSVDAFVKHCYKDRWIRPDFDWGSWAVEANAFLRDPSRVRDVDGDVIGKLLTAHIRADRFVEGHLDDVVRSKLFEAIGQRAAELAAAHPDAPAGRSAMNLQRIRELLPVFNTTFLDTPKGRDHMAWFPAGRATGRQNLQEAIRRHDAGEDVTDYVLTCLLPHLDSPYNRERGAWRCIAPVVTRDIKQWFEGSGWAKPDDWPRVAALLFRFIRSVTSDPTRLREECEAFRSSTHSKGFQSGFLSPILNAVGPENFSLVNSKTKKTLQELADLKCYTRLKEYPASNALLHQVVNELSADLPVVPVEGVLPGDVFDAFCHWYVSIYDGKKEPLDADDEAGEGQFEPSDVMERLFPDDAERRRMLGLMAAQIEMAQVQSPSCWEVSVRKHRIRLIVGRLVALEFKKGRFRIGLIPEDLPEALRDDLEKEERWSNEFATTPVSRLCSFELDRYQALESVLEASNREFIRVAVQTGVQTPFHRFHSPEFVDYVEAVVGKTLPRPSYQVRVERQPGKPEAKTAMVPAVRFDPRQSLFHKVDYTVGHLASSIELGDIGLPELQRPFVWDRSKVRDLFDSMFRGFPVGFLLFWSNAQMQSSRKIGADDKQIKIPSLLVVDGQQRLTSLYVVFKGATVLNSDFTPARIEIAFRPRDGRFEVADAAIQKDPEFIPNISALWSVRGGEHRFVSGFLAKLKESKELSAEDEDIISDNISRLQNLVNYQLTALVIQQDVQEDAVADIFVRINNQGVKLDQADFILTLLSVFWPEGRKQLEEFSKASKQPALPGGVPTPFNYLIQPGPDQMLRAVIGLGFARGRMKAVYQILRGRDPETGQFRADIRDTQFARLKAAQPKVLSLNDWHAYLQTLKSAGFIGPDTISSENAVIYTYILFLLGKHQCGVEEPTLSRLIRRWFVAVMLSARYSGSAESTMDGDLGDLKEVTAPEGFITSLEKKIETILTPDFWSITLPASLETSAALAPSLLAFRAAQVVLSAPVLFSDKKVRDLLDPAMRPSTKSVEQHHLFPRAWLKRHGITTSRRINQVANLTFLEWPKNRDLSDVPPSEYVPRMRQEFTPAQFEHMQFLHALPPGWESMEYEHFLERRRRMMAQIIRQAYLALSPAADGDGLTIADAGADERQVWPLIQTVEERLRAVIRAKYSATWGNGADGLIASTLGEVAMTAVEKNRAKHLSVYGGAIDPASTDVLDYCYLGQLGQLMMSNAAWKLFQSAFRDKRQLEDMLGAVIPVRNDLAHFRRVPGRELERSRLAANDMLDAVARL